MSVTALVFIGLFALGCLLALARHPIFGLMTYVAAFYVHPPSRWWGQGVLTDVRWAFIAAAFTLLALAIRKPTVPVTPVLRNPPFIVFLAFIAWIALQSFWALDQEAHVELLSLYAKFALVIVMICRSIETERHLRWFLWSHVIGCFYLGSLAYLSHGGGRLDGVGGPGIDEANAAALQMATGVLVAGSLMLVGDRTRRLLLLLMIPFMLNGLVATISRSGFLAILAGGIIYNFFTPVRFRARVAALSVLAACLFVMLTNNVYWERISTISYKGEEIEGVDTGGGRLQIIDAQWRMFEGHPLGCGHMCTTVLSTSYLDQKYMSSQGGRASHNTFMTMLVDHGAVGGIFYVAMIFWIVRSLRRVKAATTGDDQFIPVVVAAVAATLGAITVGDLFVQYPKLEVRFWFVAVLMILVFWSGNRTEATVDDRRQAQSARKETIA